MLKLGYVGGLGLMASPSARHLVADGPAAVLRVHDRGHPGERRDACREAWRAHGASLVPTFDALIGGGDLDAVVVCCGKNGDDLPVVAEVGALLGARCREPAMLVHLSTVSTGFVDAAHGYCAARGVRYLNYPLTGGPLGAELGGGHQNGMLILASGDEGCYARLGPTLELLGRPRHLGARPAAGAETKLIGQHMVFDGCTGICSAAALHAECFADGVLGGAAQADYFDFLNGGAGGTRQWEVALGKGIKDDSWGQGFGIRHAVVDAIYAAKLAVDRGLPRLSIQPVLSLAFAFSHLLRVHPDSALATHAIARELPASRARALDDFLVEHGAWSADVEDSLARCAASLPDDVRATVALDITVADFERIGAA